MSIIVIGHKNPDTDSIVSAISTHYLLKSRGFDVQCAAQGKPAPETQFVLDRFNLKAPQELHSVAGKEVFLVDYSDLAQAPDDFKQAKLVGIIDHHKLGDVTSDNPIECWLQPVGCSNTLIKIIYDFYNIAIPKDIAGAMLCAILSDTVLFKSPTCTQADKDAAEALAKIAGVEDMIGLGMEMFKAKSNIDAPANELIFRDFKDFNMSGNKIGIGQLELISISMITPQIKEQLQQELNNIKNQGRHSALLVLTDIMKEGSELLIASDDPNKVVSALGGSYSDNIWLEGVMSRKKQVVPQLEAAFK